MVVEGTSFYVVLTHSMGGSDAVAVFTTRAKAEAFVADHPDLPGPAVRKETLVGSYAQGTYVYAAGTYDQGLDIHHHIGLLYADYDAARARVGELGTILNLMPDGRDVTTDTDEDT